jgi:two-component system, chemotaxis family, protein-glutamate methylesterase/glutaminase
MGEAWRAGERRHGYLAPGRRHMRVAERVGRATISIDNGPPIHFCKPAVDPLFSSAISVWGPRCLALILTGMGQDGLARAPACRGRWLCDRPRRGYERRLGHVGAVAKAGLCSAVLPLCEIGPRLSRGFAGEKT